jgi:hypothetical protein
MLSCRFARGKIATYCFENPRVTSVCQTATSQRYYETQRGFAMLSRRIVLSLVAVAAVVLLSANAAEACHRGGCFGGLFGGGLFGGHHCGCGMSDCGCGCESSCDDGCGCESGDCGCGCGESHESSDASGEAAPQEPASDASGNDAAPVAPEESST